jgi:hypothetical protein
MLMSQITIQPLFPNFSDQAGVNRTLIVIGILEVRWWYCGGALNESDTLPQDSETADSDTVRM